MGLRQFVNEKPVAGWVVAAVLAVIATVLLIRMSSGGGDARSVAAMTKDITIRDSETGETWTMKRGDIEKELFSRAYGGNLDPSIGLPNPKTGKLTGIPQLNDGWDELVARVKAEVDESEARYK